ncbi:MAG: RHS repeat-associated core domain-containing protein, partial [bacterium]|nr:RHS repeat-associated core domain-containing protein [bacterium]
DGELNVTELEYDELNRQTLKTYPDLATETMAYDPEGNPIERIDARGQVSTFAYDALNRETLREYRETEATTDFAQAVASTWDRNNNLLTTVESLRGGTDATTSRTYDDFDRLELVTDRWSHTLAYAYEANGNRIRLTDPNGQITSYTYDALNRVAGVLIPGGGVTAYEYFANSRLKKVIYPNGTTAEHTYDAANRIATIDNRHFGGPVSSFSYGYDLNGNRVEQVESHGGQPAETTAYVYDTADRLFEVTYPDKITTYSYDAAGNRSTETETDLDGTTTQCDRGYVYNDRNQLTAVTDLLDASASVTYGYDANGNQVSRSTGGGEATALTYDIRNRLTDVTKDAATLGTYGYDHQGLRVSKQTTGSGLERYVYDDQSVLLRTSDTGRATKYDYGPFRLLSVDDTTDGRAYYLFDALGSVSDLTDPQGVVLGRYLWDAWGNKRQSIEIGANPFGFTGHEHDAESGLIYAKARFYDPEIGIFLSEDPVAGDPANPPSLHRYLYAYQNPTVFVDPDGREAEPGILETLLGYLTGEKFVEPPVYVPPGSPDREAMEAEGRRITSLPQAVVTGTVSAAAETTVRSHVEIEAGLGVALRPFAASAVAENLLTAGRINDGEQHLRTHFEPDIGGLLSLFEGDFLSPETREDLEANAPSAMLAYDETGPLSILLLAESATGTLRRSRATISSKFGDDLLAGFGRALRKKSQGVRALFLDVKARFSGRLIPGGGRLTAHPNAHTLTRHGGAVTDEQLAIRARTGIAPDGYVKIGSHGDPILPPVSSAFHSDRLAARAERVLREGPLRDAIAADPTQSVHTVTGEIGANIGRGYSRIGSARFRGKQGPLQFHPSMSRAQGTFELDPETGQWNPITVFPDL